MSNDASLTYSLPVTTFAVTLAGYRLVRTYPVASLNISAKRYSPLLRQTLDNPLWTKVRLAFLRWRTQKAFYRDLCIPFGEV
jgi:hypothetical protein